jgi:hypothetical protein
MTGNKNYFLQHVLKGQTFGFYAIKACVCAHVMKEWGVGTLKCCMTIMKPPALHKPKKKDQLIHLLTYCSNKWIPRPTLFH